MLSLRQNKRSSFPGHAPGKDTLRAANAATKEGFTGRKRVKRKRLPVVFPSFSERGLTGENARANAVSRRALSPVKRKRGSRGENRISVSEFCCLPVLLLCLPVCHTVPTTLTVAVPGMTFHVPSAFCVYVAAGTTICPATVANAPVALS